MPSYNLTRVQDRVPALGRLFGLGSALAIVAVLTSGSAIAQDKETLHCSIDPTFAPHAMVNLKGELEGFQIDLFTEVARRMGRAINIEAMAHAGEFPALSSKRIDFICGPMTVTEARAETILFTEPYLWTAWQFAIKKGNAPITSEEGLRGRTFSVIKGIPAEKWFHDNAERLNVKVLPFEGQADAIQAVLQNRAYGYVNGSSAVKYVATQVPGVVPDWVMPDTRTAWAAPFHGDSAELRKEIEDVLVCMKRDGFIADISEKWFGVAPQAGDAELTEFPGYGTPGFKGYDTTPQNPICEQ
ncbi:transporter substrate-binding domain-containing protein [Limibacillus sp. MBR-115]|uniref:transporter substrate-binding domain-containing protein n=1 Tax=Limibacillus sp. MBR-115 TaxID=3156465 RepID=UPI003394C89C